MDLLGGHAAEESVLMHRHNDSTGARFVWEQEGFNLVTRHIHAYITLKDPDTKKVLHACGSLSSCRAGYARISGSPWHFEAAALCRLPTRWCSFDASQHCEGSACKQLYCQLKCTSRADRNLCCRI